MRSEMEIHHHSSGRQRRPRVTEENRKRAVRACDACRQQKEKCQGGIPCVRCTKYRRPCEFNMTPKPRLPGPGSAAYGSNMHAELEAEREKNRYMATIISHFVGDTTTFDIDSLKQLAESLRIEPPSRTDSFSEADMQELGNLAIEDEKFTVRPLSDNTAHYSGEFSHWSFGERIQRRINEWAREADSEVMISHPGTFILERFPADIKKGTSEDDQIKEFWRATKLQSHANIVPEIVESFPPPQVAHFLIQTFLKFCETNYYLVDDIWLYEKLDLCYSRPETLNNDDAGMVCVILAIFAIGTQYAHIQSGSQQDGSREDDSVDSGNSAEDDIGLTFYRLACKLVPDVITLASLESVQAFLLLGVYTLPIDTGGLCYTYLGIALKMAIQNGMHRRYTGGGGLDPRRVELRNRLWWSAYAMESILHGRPTSIAIMDIDADLPKDIPELQPTDGSPSTFANRSAMITLTVRLGDIAEQISLIRRCPRRRHTEHLERLLVLRKRLMDWWNSLPEELYCRDLRPQGPLFRRNVHLKLNYHLSQIFMGRCFIFQPTRGPSASPAEEAAKQAQSSSKSLLVNDCIQSALDIIDLCQLLRHETGLARASYTEFSSCRAAMLAILAQSLNEQNDRLRTALTQGMRLIRPMAVGIDSAKSDVSLIEALERAIRRLDARERGSSSGNPQVGAAGPPSGYETFKNWATLWRNAPNDFGGSGSGSGSGTAGMQSSNAVAASSTSPLSGPGSGSIPANPLVQTQQRHASGSPFSPAGAAASGEDEGTNTNGSIFSATNSMSPTDQNNIHRSSVDMMDFMTSTTDIPNLADFGFDNFLSPFPQELTQFSLISDFDPHLSHPSVPSPDQVQSQVPSPLGSASVPQQQSFPPSYYPSDLPQ
ncbi:hypothetical protein L228DRAFT_275586 [Xylona heveae TC161]|uniref:Zn(2)-C6 fungal-type domain-containing protein n=1 Tax=Xylona heveae (strain CBS 132557 / TC161) TaxID=1328760 RepID=A0A161TEC3_XYLHT|nr:hypothetical protein L228DRAFT_275586 [Xylona heveae TC161]KZF24287.1 hypothetical protein L228DRAFT_275586 [Xylona heveae TC161]